MQNKKPNQKRIKGNFFEEIAKKYLINKGYRLLEKNFRDRTGEIDLIMTNGKTLILVEVKGRKKSPFLNIERTVNREKIKRILKTAEIYISDHKLEFDEIRVDTVFVEKMGSAINVMHFENWI